MSSYQRIARIITRPSSSEAASDSPVDLILGSAIKGQTLLKPNRIYILEDYFGELVLRDHGPAALGEERWGQDISTLLSTEGTQLFANREEYEQLKAK